MFYAALDVSLRSVAVCIIDQEGKVSLSTPSGPLAPGLDPDLARRSG